MAYNKKKLVEQLEGRLKWYYNEATEEEFDTEDIDAICAMLEKLDPISDQFPPADVAYQKLKERIAREDAEMKRHTAADTGETAEMGKVCHFRGKDGENTDAKATDLMDAIGREKKKRKRGIRAAVIICVGVLSVGILMLNCYTEAYADKSLFTMIMEKTGVVKVRMMGSTEKSVDENLELTETYDSWSDLDIDIKSKIVVPGYIPEGYSLYNIEYNEHYDKTTIVANYYNNTGEHLIFYITSWEDGINLYSEKIKEDERVGEYLSEYSDEDEGIFYYHCEDEYICLTSTEYYYYKIMGNITLEELEKVREGLKENK